MTLKKEHKKLQDLREKQQAKKSSSRGILVFNLDGTFQYTVEGYSGNDSFTFRAFDGLAWSEPALVSITVEGAPIIAPEEPEEPEETEIPEVPVAEQEEEEDRELPQTGGTVYYSIGLLLLAGGALTLKKNKK